MRVIEWVAACVPEIEVERDIERLSDLLGEKLEVWVGVADAEKEIVTELETDGLGVEEIGCDGDIIPTLPKK